MGRLRWPNYPPTAFVTMEARCAGGCTAQPMPGLLFCVPARLDSGWQTTEAWAAPESPHSPTTLLPPCTPQRDLSGQREAQTNVMFFKRNGVPSGTLMVSCCLPAGEGLAQQEACLSCRKACVLSCREHVLLLHPWKPHAGPHGCSQPPVHRVRPPLPAVAQAPHRPQLLLGPGSRHFGGAVSTHCGGAPADWAHRQGWPAYGQPKGGRRERAAEAWVPAAH